MSDGEGFGLIVPLDEETRAKFEAAAKRAGMGLIEWMLDTLGVAADPDAGQVVRSMRYEGLE